MGKKTTVLCVLPTWCPTFQNKNIGKLFRHFSDYEFIVFGGSYKVPFDFKKVFGNVTYYPWRVNGGRSFVSLLCLLFLILKHKITLILWCYWGYTELKLFLFLKLVGICDYIVKADSLTPCFPESNNSIKNKLRKIIELLILKQARLICVETREIHKRYKAFSPDNEVLYLPNGLEFDVLNCVYSRYKANEILKYKNNTILYTGRINYDKGVDVLVNSFKAINDSIPDWNLLIVGEIWDSDYYDSIISSCKELITSKRIEFKSFKSGFELYEIYLKSKIFVLPSRHEGLPNRLPEAMFFENAVIGTNVGQVKSFLTEYPGICIENEDEKSMSEAILKLINNNELRVKFIREGREKVLKNLNNYSLLNGLKEKIQND